tara:strand:- start:3460 stop:3567 length:108 start_codon:yes stop_codon:yes gene_type:complete
MKDYEFELLIELLKEIKEELKDIKGWFYNDEIDTL